MTLEFGLLMMGFNIAALLVGAAIVYYFIRNIK